MLFLRAPGQLVLVCRTALRHRHVPPARLVGPGRGEVALDPDVHEGWAAGGQCSLDRRAHLVGALREGSVTLVNALGSGVLETRTFLAFLPRIAEGGLEDARRWTRYAECYLLTSSTRSP